MTMIFLFILSLLPILDLLHPGLPVTHDGVDHVARIANFYTSLSEGNIVPRWAANLNWGYGHPVVMFLYPLPSYIASLFHAIGFSFVDSTKLVFAVSFVASIFSMYLFASSAWGVKSGIVAATLYGFAPYRFVDLYVRGAIGEHLAFIFPPLVCYGLLRQKYWLITLSTAFLILSHNALSIMFFPFILLYTVYLSSVTKKYPLQRFVFSIWYIVLGFLLSGFYWIPAFFEGKYTLRDIVTAGEFSDRFVPWLSFLYSPWSYGGSNDLTKWLGAAGITVILWSVSVLEKKESHRKILLVLLLLLFFTLFAMTKNSQPLWQSIRLLQKFQFPWRLMSVSVFLIAVIGGISVFASEKRLASWLAAVVVSISIVSTFLMWRAKDYKTYPDSFVSGIYYGTTDTGESSPIWSVRFMERKPEKSAYLMPDEGQIVPGKRTTTERQYLVTINTPVRFIENTLYFPGWKVYTNGVEVTTDRLIFQDPTYRGLMTFHLDPGQYDIRFVFTETKLRSVANAISIVAIALFWVSNVTIQKIWKKL